MNNAPIVSGLAPVTFEDVEKRDAVRHVLVVRVDLVGFIQTKPTGSEARPEQVDSADPEVYTAVRRVEPHCVLRMPEHALAGRVETPVGAEAFDASAVLAKVDQCMLAPVTMTHPPKTSLSIRPRTSSR